MGCWERRWAMPDNPNFPLRCHDSYSKYLSIFTQFSHFITQSAGAVEYTNNENPGYDTKQSDGDVPVMLELWGIWSTLSLLLLPGPLWPGIVAPDRALSMD